MTWTPQAATDLLHLVAEIMPHRQKHKEKGSAWEKVAQRLAEQYPGATFRNCQEKCADLLRSYRHRSRSEQGRGSSGTPQDKSDAEKELDDLLADIAQVRFCTRDLTHRGDCAGRG